MPRKIPIAYRKKRCGAKSRRNAGAPCQNWAVGGAERCRMHGGTHPKGGKAPQALTSLKHGLFAKSFTDEEKLKFAEAYGEMMDDPAMALLADAALLRVKASTVAERADKMGMYVARRSGSTRMEPMLHEDGSPMTYKPFDDSNERKPLMKQTTTTSAEQQDVIGPVSELLMRAARLTEAAVLIKRKAADENKTGDGKVIDRDVALSIMKDVFSDGGALEPPERGADGAVSPSGPTSGRRG